jgi:hypothetical protein
MVSFLILDNNWKKTKGSLAGKWIDTCCVGSSNHLKASGEKINIPQNKGVQPLNFGLWSQQYLK